MIELDVQLSRDEQLVVMHDLDLARTTNGKGRVRDHDLVALQLLDSGGWFGGAFVGQPILTLEEVIDVIGPGVRLNVEVKAPAEDWPVLMRRLLALLVAHGRLGSTIVSCFETEALQVLRRISTAVRLGLLWQNTEIEEAWRWAREIDAASLHPFWMFIDADVVATAHARGLQVITWTVNEIDAMRKLVNDGVDGIISDFPERFGQLEAHPRP